MVLEFILGEHFRERVCHIIICWHSFHFHIISCYYLPDEMITPEYMLGSLMRPRFLCLCNGSIVVTINSYWINDGGKHFKLYYVLTHPNCFLCRFESCDILCFCGGVDNRRLLGTFSTDYTSIQLEDES